MVGLPAGDETLVPALSRGGFRDRPSRNFKSILMKANHPGTDWQCHFDLNVFDGRIAVFKISKVSKVS